MTTYLGRTIQRWKWTLYYIAAVVTLILVVNLLMWVK